MKGPDTKPLKILSVMYELGKGRPVRLSYEDIVVRAFETYPQDFQLRGYPKYPDSSDIHKPLYAMKKKGLVRSADKTFQLTDMGVEVASRIAAGHQGVPTDRLTKQEEHEIARICASAAFALHESGRAQEILDTDFYDYLGVSVRTRKSDFAGRVAVVDNAVKAHRQKISDQLSGSLVRLHDYLVDRFKTEMDARR